jgi:AcrR family transcriptional regulator
VRPARSTSQSSIESAPRSIANTSAITFLPGFRRPWPVTTERHESANQTLDTQPASERRNERDPRIRNQPLIVENDPHPVQSDPLVILHHTSDLLIPGRDSRNLSLPSPIQEVILRPDPDKIGGFRLRIASWQLRINDGTALPELGEDLVTWIRSYAVPAGHARWSTGPHALLPAGSPQGSPALATPLLSRPDPLPRGRHGLPRGVVERNRRERIIHATAETIQAKGYAAVTVGDIAVAAGIGKDVFYEHFSDKRHVFLAAQQHAAHETFNACARAYFAGRSWPERVYHGLRALTQIIAAEPALAHLRIVAPYAAGPEAIERAQQMSAMYAVFLQEGYGYRPEAKQLPYLCSGAIVDAVFEIIRGQIAAGNARELPRHVPQLAYIAIAPFSGAQAAGELIEALG